MAAFWFVLGAILILSASLNAYQVVVVEELSTQIFRGVLSLAFLLGAVLSIRKGLAETSK